MPEKLISITNPVNPLLNKKLRIYRIFIFQKTKLSRNSDEDDREKSVEPR